MTAKKRTAKIKRQEVIQQPHVVAGTTAAVELDEVSKVWCECAPRKNKAASFQLKLIDVLIFPFRIQNGMPQLAPAVDSHEERRIRRV